ncbi:MAG: hypothetical protein IPH13_20355 [Planctomycetes bacterium]|nr:hypothetical protein [Planctomycetota bacterium]
MKLATIYRGVRHLLNNKLGNLAHAMVEDGRMIVTNGRALASVPITREPEDPSKMFVVGSLLRWLCTRVRPGKGHEVRVEAHRGRDTDNVIQQSGACLGPKGGRGAAEFYSPHSVEDDPPDSAYGILVDATSMAKKWVAQDCSKGIDIAFDAQALRDLADALGALPTDNADLPVTLTVARVENKSGAVLLVRAGRGKHLRDSAADAIGCLNADVRVRNPV